MHLPLIAQCRALPKSTQTKPLFGFGGRDENNQPRPLPEPNTFRYTLKPADIGLPIPLLRKKFKLSPIFVQHIYQSVFRKSLSVPGFVLVEGLTERFNGDMKKIRAFQIQLGETLSQLRSKELELKDADGFSLKYIGRSNKVKKNPLHQDTRSTDSIVLMTYEPMKNIEAYPYFTDLTQYAVDKKLSPLNLVSSDLEIDPTTASELGYQYRVKSHYGHQIESDHHPELLADYSYDLTELKKDAIQMVIFNDSVGLEARGLSHGVRHLEVLDSTQPVERYFNHVVFDIPNRELSRLPNQNMRPGEQATYYLKSKSEQEQTPLPYKQAVQQYIEEGSILYRNPTPH